MKAATMKILLVLSLCFVCVNVQAGPIETISINEHGVCTWVDIASTSGSFAGSRIADPSGTGLDALVYDTRLIVNTFNLGANGDYIIYKPNTEEIVGVVRFYDNRYLIFYDNDTAPFVDQSLADRSGLPATYQSTQVRIDQTNPNGAITQTTVTPEAGMPGFVDGVNRQYTFLSSLPVPEPGVFALLACGAALLGLRRKRPVL